MPTFEFKIEELRKIRDLNPDCDSINFTLDGELAKCNGCNWEVSKLFVQARSRKHAVELLLSGDAGLCGECFAECLVEDGENTW